MAVLEKRLGMKLDSCDAYVNIAGGMRLNEPAIDLAIVCAIISSYKNFEISGRTIIFGEVGLTGEVRAVNMVEQRVMEAKGSAPSVCIVPQVNMKSLEKVEGIAVIGVSTVMDIMKYLK